MKLILGTMTALLSIGFLGAAILSVQETYVWMHYIKRKKAFWTAVLFAFLVAVCIVLSAVSAFESVKLFRSFFF